MRTKIIQQGYRCTTLNEASKERVHTENVYSAINEVLNLYFFFFYARDPYYLSERVDSMNN